MSDKTAETKTKGPQTYSERRLLEIAEAADKLNTRVGLMLAMNIVLVLLVVILAVVTGSR